MLVHDLFDSIFNDFFYDLPRTNYSKLISSGSFPPSDIWVDKETKTCNIQVALAGVPENAIAVDYDSGKMKLFVNCGKDENDEKYTIQNGIRKIGKLTTSWAIDDSYYDVEKTNVTFVNGLLTISIPAKEEIAKPTVKRLFGETKNQLEDKTENNKE